MRPASEMLTQDENTLFILGLVEVLLFAMVVRLQRASIAFGPAGRLSLQAESIDPAGYRREKEIDAL